MAEREQIIPEHGTFRGWKKCRKGVLVELEIPAGARRSNPYKRACRAERAVVIQVVGADVGVSLMGGAVYRVGETVESHKWTEDQPQVPGVPFVEGGGIYFWMTKGEAERYWPRSRIRPMGRIPSGNDQRRGAPASRRANRY